MTPLPRTYVNLTSSANPANTPVNLVSQYNLTLLSHLNMHAPIKSKIISERTKSRRYTLELVCIKWNLRKMKGKSNLIGLHINIYNLKSDNYNTCLQNIKRSYYTNAFTDCTKYQLALFNLVDRLLHNTSPSPLPSLSDPSQLADDSINFIKYRIIKSHGHLANITNVESPTTVYLHAPLSPAKLTSFNTIFTADLRMVINKSLIKSGSLDLLPALLFQQAFKDLLPAVKNFIHRLHP